MTNAKQMPKTVAPKPPVKTSSRLAAQAETAEVQKTPAAEPVAVAAPEIAPMSEPLSEPVSAAAPAKVRSARPAHKRSAVDQTVAKHQKALAEALEKAEAISYDPPEAAKAKPAKAVKIEKVKKAKKAKLVRNSYVMPETEYANIAVLKKRLGRLGKEVKKSELLRAGVLVLAGLNDTELQAVIGRVERIKTGRPAKK